MTAKKTLRPEGFDVTVSQIIGRVEFDSTEGYPPIVAAAKIIADHQSVTNEPAEYLFPSEYGGKVYINITSDE